MYYLGVDGGGTKTAFMIINQQGEILAYHVGGTCHYIQIGFTRTRQVLKEGIINCCQQAGVEINDLEYSFLGLPAHGEILEDSIKLEEIVADIFGDVNHQCGNDVKAGWAGSLACKPGINLVAGTGAIGFGQDQTGNTARSSGWGYFCGDEGSAYWLGKQLISIFTKEADGRVDRTALYDIIRDEFQLERDLDFISVLYNKLERKRDSVAGLALLLYQAALAGDPEAINIYREAAWENSLTVKAIINQLNFKSDEEILVSYSGGVFKAGKIILNPLKEFLQKEGVKLIRPILQPVTGAALYALKQTRDLTGETAVINKLKSAEERLLQ